MGNRTLSANVVVAGAPWGLSMRIYWLEGAIYGLAAALLVWTAFGGLFYGLLGL